MLVKLKCRKCTQNLLCGSNLYSALAKVNYLITSFLWTAEYMKVQGF